MDVDDIALLHLRMADDTLGLVEISRMGTGTTNELVLEIFGDQGAIRFNAADPSWLEVYDVRDPGQPLGGMKGFRKLETVQHFEGQKSPDWSMPPSFLRTHTECQYQFLKAISDNTSTSPTLEDGLQVQRAMAAAERSSEQGRWVHVDELQAE